MGIEAQVSLNRYAAKKDGNQSTIIAELEARGATVEILGKPLDLLVAYRNRWVLVEVKANEYESRRQSKTRNWQLSFAERHPNGGPIATVWDAEGVRTLIRTLDTA